MYTIAFEMGSTKASCHNETKWIVSKPERVVWLGNRPCPLPFIFSSTSFLLSYSLPIASALCFQLLPSFQCISSRIPPFIFTRLTSHKTHSFLSGKRACLCSIRCRQRRRRGFLISIRVSSIGLTRLIKERLGLGLGKSRIYRFASVATVHRMYFCPATFRLGFIAMLRYQCISGLANTCRHVLQQNYLVVGKTL